jgi:hypothetical protein
MLNILQHRQKTTGFWGGADTRLPDLWGLLGKRADRSVCPTLGYGSSCLSVAWTLLCAQQNGEIGVYQRAPEVAATQVVQPWSLICLSHVLLYRGVTLRRRHPVGITPRRYCHASRVRRPQSRQGRLATPLPYHMR